MATVALGDSRVITGCVPDSQRRRDIDDSVDQTDRLQAKHIKALLELKLFDLGWLMPRTWLQGSVIFAQALIKTCPDECKTPGSRRGGGPAGSTSHLSGQTRGLPSPAAGSRSAPSPKLVGLAGRAPHETRRGSTHQSPQMRTESVRTEPQIAGVQIPAGRR